MIVGQLIESAASCSVSSARKPERCTSLLRAPVSEMTYTVSSGTINSTIPYHTIPCLFTAVGASKHAGVKKSLVFQIDKPVGQSVVEVEQTACSVSSTQLIRFLEFSKLQLVFCRLVITKRIGEKFHQQSALVEVSKPSFEGLNQNIITFQHKPLCQYPESSVALEWKCDVHSCKINSKKARQSHSYAINEVPYFLNILTRWPRGAG